MPYWTEMTAACPQCGKTATGDYEIDDVFGFRTVNGKRIPQSWCKECRSKGTAYDDGCAYNLCPWNSEYPNCIDSGKCPLEDD